MNNASHRQRGKEGSTVPLQPHEAEYICLCPSLFTNFYRCTIKSILSGRLTAWYGNCTARNRRALQRVLRST